MANRRQIEKQIQTMEALGDIIHSMRSLAATYLSRAQERLDGVRAYSETVGQAIEDCLYGREIRLPEEESTSSAVIAFFSQQGLCGRFNEVMAEAAAKRAREVNRPRFIVVGKRGPALVKRERLEILADLASSTSPDGLDNVIHGIARTVLKLHEENAFGKLYILHAHYLSPGRIAVTFQRILPVDLSQWRKKEALAEGPPFLAMPRLSLLSELVNEYTFVSLFRALTESLAGENGMRLQSMEAAKSNLEETLADLSLQARLQRQNEITEELLDVVAGAEALRGDSQE